MYDLFHVVAKYGREVIDRVRVDETNRVARLAKIEDEDSRLKNSSSSSSSIFMLSCCLDACHRNRLQFVTLLHDVTDVKFRTKTRAARELEPGIGLAKFPQCNPESVDVFLSEIELPATHYSSPAATCRTAPTVRPHDSPPASPETRRTTPC